MDIINVIGKILIFIATIYTLAIFTKISEKQDYKYWRKQFKSEQQENQAFRAGIKKSDMPSYEEWKAERQKQEP